jgi:hypothetical protein
MAAPLLLPSGDSVAPGGPSLLRDPAFILPISMHILFHLDSSLCSVSPSSRTPTPGADRAQGGAMGHGPHDSLGEVAHNGGAPTPEKIAAAGVVAPEAPEAVTSDGSLAPSLDTTTAADMTGAAPFGSSISVSSPQPQMGAVITLVVAGDDILEEPEVVQEHPLLMFPGDVSLDEAMGAQPSVEGASTGVRRHQ